MSQITIDNFSILESPEPIFVTPCQHVRDGTKKENARGLCMNCYSRASRDGTLQYYPMKRKSYRMEGRVSKKNKVKKIFVDASTQTEELDVPTRPSTPVFEIDLNVEPLTPPPQDIVPFDTEPVTPPASQEF